MAIQKLDPTVKSTSRASMDATLHLALTLWGGTKAMRAAGETYLPKHAKEVQADWDRRRDGSFLFNGYKRAIKFLKGKPFSKPVKYPDNMPERTTELIDDVDAQGNTLAMFAHEFFELALRDGLRFCVIDMPKASPELERASARQRRQAGVRPHLVHVDPRQFLGATKQRRNGRDIITSFRYLDVQEIKDPANEFAIKNVTTVRVYEETAPGVVQLRIFTQVERRNKIAWDEEIIPLRPIKRVPVLEYYTGKTGQFTADPPLLDLGDLNVEHFQSASDQRHILHLARVPIRVFTGVTQEELGDAGLIGANYNVVLHSEMAKAFYMEISGAAMAAGRQDLEDIENRMRVMGLDLLARKVMTATERTQDQQGADSDLGAMVKELAEMLGQAIAMMHEWEGDPDPEIVPDINTEFSVSSADIDALEKLRLLRVDRQITQELLLSEYQRRGVIAEGVELADEIEATSTEEDAEFTRLRDSQPPQLPPQPEPDNGDDE